MSASDVLASMGITLPGVPPPAAAYVPWVRSEGHVLTSGQLPMVDGALPATGLVGQDVTVAEAQDLARLCAINLLAIADEASDGDLDRVQFVKLTCFVASADGFTEQHLVANGASLFLGEVLGDGGRHARSAVGVPRLPLDSPVEIEAILRTDA